MERETTDVSASTKEYIAELLLPLGRRHWLVETAEQIIQAAESDGDVRQGLAAISHRLSSDRLEGGQKAVDDLASVFYFRVQNETRFLSEADIQTKVRNAHRKLGALHQGVWSELAGEIRRRAQANRDIADRLKNAKRDFMELESELTPLVAPFARLTAEDRLAPAAGGVDEIRCRVWALEVPCWVWAAVVILFVVFLI